MRTISFSEARESLESLIDEVVEGTDVTVITRTDAPGAVVMSLDYYNGLMETMYLLSSAENAAHLAKSMAQARAGQVHPRELIDVPDTEGEPDAHTSVHRGGLE
ncbi:type II toxin-antitoxin system prevent-host-death family antitoxin [Massilia arenosa]|uniref:Antitoxin n=1 Tax=Zemynaea arenosa TaxID=2561931 RepID=A0A4Y9SDC9_9BURK|nr:type II toxin-antitoxin system prevent-host-death family antitoxin [Massilia arenosa]TFW17830.1 type II toxin-antitoxin system prevent-host-death family antitoxin [Massilia arenosa]